MKLKTIDTIFFVWTILVFVAIAYPSPDIPDITKFDFSDKIVHMILFGVFSFLTNGALRARGVGKKRAKLISFLGGAAYSGLAEIIQLFVPGRSSELFDFYAGVVGAVLAIVFISLKKTGINQ
jgi:VanZ family protein